MLKIIKSKSWIFVLFITLNLIFSIISRSQTLDEKLKKIITKSGLKVNDFGVEVSDYSHVNEKVLVSINSNKKLIPASLTKILTAGMSLEKFPSNYEFSSEILALSKPTKNRIDGSVFFKGGGDPGFVSENMWYLVNEFVRTGVTQIDGDIIVDESRFDDERFDSGRDPERVDRAYDAPIGALSFNWNSVNVFIRPGQTVGSDAQVYIDPKNDYIKLMGEVKTGKQGRNSDIKISRLDGNENTDIIQINGSIPINSKELVFYKGVMRPDLWSGANLKSFLLQRGVQVKGTVKVGKAPEDAVLLARVGSKPLSLIITDMMKFSNNFVAEMLTKNLSAEFLGVPGNMKGGVKLLSDYVIEKGFSSDDFYISSPSGLSRKNKLTPKLLVKVLNDISSNFSISSEFISSLPIAGIDGTLKSRMKNSPAVGKVRAKTGMLTGVVGLAGFASTKDKTQLTFAFMFNGKSNETEKARNVIDLMAIELASQ